jgi:hypothetical protein
MPAYVPMEYPRYVGNVRVNNEAEHQALRAALAEAAAAARAVELGRPPSPGAARMQRSRERRREGRRCVQIEISDAEIAELVRAGLLAVDAQDDVGAIAEAINALLAAPVPVSPASTPPSPADSRPCAAGAGWPR